MIPLKRTIRAVSGIAITTGIMGIAIIIIGYTLHPAMFSSASSLFSWLINPNSEVVFSPSNGVIKPTLTLGAILPLTGISSSLGESEEAALHIAVEDVNDYFSKINSSSRVELIVEDTETNPLVSLEKLKQLEAKNIKIVIGPATSAELQAVEVYANENGILLVSPSSTAPSMDIRGGLAGNNILRLVPDDTHQAQAVSQQMSLNRINFIIWDQELKSLENKVKQAISQYGADKVGVYVVAFDEIAPIFIQGDYRTVLPTVKWYGSDGSALNNNLIKNIGAANFALKTNISNPIFGVENDNDVRLNRVENEIHRVLERSPRSYASVAYDIFWIASLTENEIKMNATQSDFNSLKKTFENVANSYRGITGNTTLNSVGDRKYGDYDFWAIRASNNNDGNHNGLVWKKVSKYIYNNSTSTEGTIRTIPTG